MSILNDPAGDPPFKTLMSLDNDTVAKYLARSVANRCYTDIGITFKFDSNGSEWDRILSPTRQAIITGTKDGRTESEPVDINEVARIVAAELTKDGHVIQAGTAHASIGNDQKAHFNCTLLVPRKVN